MYDAKDEDFDAHGLQCEARVHTRLGHLCGYVRLPKGHPFYGKHYDDLDLDVHGGLTYSREAEDGTWKIGFDCAHLGDLVPMNPIRGMDSDGDVFRDNDFVRRECTELARQLAEAK